MKLARLLFPAIRWNDETGFEGEAESIERALELGVGGFIIFGGVAGEVRALTEKVRGMSSEPLLFGADLERGAGQQFRGATELPPVAALGSLDDLEATRRAGEVTGREARGLGVDWVYAPVADLDIEPRNPIVGTRAFGSDPEFVSAQVGAWVDGCRAGGALSCAKHFPGHGRTTSDSHLALPLVSAGRDALEADLAPFRSAIDAGVDSIMSAHVAYPSLDPSGTPATLSHAIVTGILREELGFEGLVVTDALIMEGVLRGGRGEGAAAVEALRAGCDILLYPDDPAAVAGELEAALGGALTEERVAESIERLERAVEKVFRSPGGDDGWGREEERGWALELAVRAIEPMRGGPVSLAGGVVELFTIDDDLGGPFPPPSRDHLPERLRTLGLEVRPGGLGGGRSGDVVTLVALYADIRGWKGRPGLSDGAVAELGRILAERPGALVVLFGHPRLASEIPGEPKLAAAWGGDPLMQEAAASWLYNGWRGE